MSRSSPGAVVRRVGPGAPTAATEPAQPQPDPAEANGAAPAVQTDGLDGLYRRHAAWLVSALRRRFGGEQAEDLAQEAFARLGGYADAEIRRPRALLMTIAGNAAYEQHRRRRIRAPDAAQGTGFAEDDRWQDAEQDAQLLLKQIIASLPTKLRDVFVLHRFEGLTHEEIARRLNISPKTVEWRMSKALAICAARLRD